jgi:hypothetical protein
MAEDQWRRGGQRVGDAGEGGGPPGGDVIGDQAPDIAVARDLVLDGGVQRSGFVDGSENLPQGLARESVSHDRTV